MFGYAMIYENLEVWSQEGESRIYDRIVYDWI